MSIKHSPLPLLLSLAATASLAQVAAPLVSPASGGLLAGRQALIARQGQAAVASPSPATQAAAPTATKPCTAKVCALPEVAASELPGRSFSHVIAANPTAAANLVVTANDFNCPDSYQASYFSIDSGGSWSRSCLGALPAHTGLGDTAIAFDRHGVAYAAGINTRDYGFTSVISVQKSTDQGASWAAPTLAASNTLGALADKPAIEADNSPTSPYRDSIYLSVAQISPLSGTQITVSRSRDGGSTWASVAASPRYALPDLVEYSDLAVARDGSIYLSYLKCRQGGDYGVCGGTDANMMVQKSTDGGLNWSTPVRMTTVRLAPAPCGQMYGCIPNTDGFIGNAPIIAIDNSDGPNQGRLYSVAYTYRRGLMRTQLVTSSDAGAHWSRPVALTPGETTGDQMLPWVSVSASGEVGVTWLDRRNDPENRLYQPFSARSTDGGASFQRNMKVTGVKSDPSEYNQPSFILGEMAGNAWVGDTLFMSWVDTRSGLQQAFVGGTTRP